ncbi:hypothetical protein [Paenibacillus xylaniclasticus]|uniref:hypothetical protein n=1 Tax=Paenibacillus xylaniclasticus TaxID=588083 RepID=UPI000FD6BFE1|nr:MULTISPECIES: hypothetical protein [Paenibacillus]GFN32589.1 hypothetical protein PCURB6_28490 [Paenibacillus curdlanolyticus]
MSQKKFSKKVVSLSGDNETVLKICSCCNKSKNAEKNFYKSNSKFHSDGRVGICKDCVRENVNANDILSVKTMLLHLNRPFLASYWDNAVLEGEKKGQEPFGLYLKTLQLNGITKDLTWLESDHENKDNIQVSTTSQAIDNQLSSLDDSKNRDDVIRLIGYDPFLYENPDDKKSLYDKLVDFLDESTLEDSFKLPVVIEIVKTFNQIDKMNSALALMLADTSSMMTNTGSIKSLIETKDKMYKSVLALAKDNGISVNHNNNKSKGGNTLNGIVKKLNEIGLEDATVNLFDLETCEAMKQIADISHRSILDQLLFDENDYAEMLAEQKEIIRKHDEKTTKLEEEVRLLKIKLKRFESLENE